MFSCLLAEITLQAEDNSFLPSMPSHNNQRNERQQNLITEYVDRSETNA